MIDGRLLTEKLLNYAQTRLELADYDVPVKRNLLLYIFRLSAGQVPEVRGGVTLKELKEEISCYACENGLAADGAEVGFVNFVLGLLLPLPSVINKKFRTMREQFGASAACEYLRSLSIGSNAIEDLDCEDYFETYYSGDGLEILIANDSYNWNNRLKKAGSCCLCASNEGAFDVTGDCGALRNVSLDLNSKPWLMHYTNSVTRAHECMIASNEHLLTDISEGTVIAMLDFIEYIPDYSVTVTNDFNKKGVQSYGHDYFIGGKFTPALVGAKPTFSGVCTVYPDVEVSVFNKNVSVVRLQSFNRNTLERLAIELVEAWAHYKDDSMGIFGMGADGSSRNKATLYARYSADNRYSIDIILTCEKVEPDHVAEEASVFDGFVNFESLFGRFVLNSEFNRVLEMVYAVVTKKIPFDESLFVKGGSLYGYKSVVQNVINDSGYFRDAQRAEEPVKRAFVSEFERTLIKIAAFLPGDDGARSFKKFLAEVNVR